MNVICSDCVAAGPRFAGPMVRGARTGVSAHFAKRQQKWRI